MPRISKIILPVGYGIISGAVATFLQTSRYSNDQERNNVATENLLRNMATGVGFAISLSCAYHAFKCCKKTINTKRVVPADARILDDVVPSASIGKITLPTIEEGIEETEFERQISAEPLCKKNMMLNKGTVASLIIFYFICHFWMIKFFSCANATTRFYLFLA